MGTCVLCEEQITTPLGPERLGEEIATWMREAYPAQLDNFRKASDELLFTGNKNGLDKCIITHKPMQVCTYCYTEHVFKWLLSTKPSWKILKEFLLHFDYDTSKYGIVIQPEEKANV